MKKYIFLYMTLFYFGLHVQAQSEQNEPGVVTGKISEGTTKEAIPYATVIVKDSNAAMLKGGLTDEKGKFKIKGLPFGEHSLEVQYLGYENIVKTISITKGSSKVSLGNLSMLESATELDEVLVVDEKSQVNLNLDKKIYNVGKDIISKSGTVSDILDNVPSVTVDPSGVVSLRGNSNVNILINGRRSGLTLNNALDQIPADNIERIEVITNPSARYESSGSAGIINIVLKKNKKDGLNGQIMAIAGTPDDYRLIPSLNYKTNKVNLFSTFGYRYTDYQGYYTNDQTTNNDEVPISLSQTEDEDRHDDGKYIYLGADYYLNAQNTFTAAYFKNATEDTDETFLNYDYSSAGTLDSTITRTGNSKEVRDYNQLEINYSKTFDKEGMEWATALQYDFWNSDKTWDLSTQKTFPDVVDVAPIRTSSIGSSKDLVLQSDFISPVGDSSMSTIEMGIKLENRSVNSDYLAEELSSDQWQVYDDINNVLKYNERIGGAYIQFGTQLNKFSYLLGLRAEYTDVEIDDDARLFSDKKDYLRLFPTAHLNYVFSDATSTQLSYSRRINRPSLWDIYPFFELKDFNSQYVGNPEINPSYTDAFEWSVLQHWNKVTFNPAIYFKHTTDYFQYFTSQDATTGIFITTPINLDEENSYGFEASLSYNAAKWLRLGGEFNIYGFDQKGSYEGRNFDFTSSAWYARMNTRIQFPLGFTMQGRVTYIGEVSNAQTKAKSQFHGDMAISKNLFKDKATVMLNIFNIFNSRQDRETTIGEDYVLNQTRRRNVTRYGLSFIYRFNRKANQRDRRQNRSNRN